MDRIFVLFQGLSFSIPIRFHICFLHILNLLLVFDFICPNFSLFLLFMQLTIWFVIVWNHITTFLQRVVNKFFLIVTWVWDLKFINGIQNSCVLEMCYSAYKCLLWKGLFWPLCSFANSAKKFLSPIGKDHSITPHCLQLTICFLIKMKISRVNGDGPVFS